MKVFIELSKSKSEDTKDSQDSGDKEELSQKAQMIDEINEFDILGIIFAFKNPFFLVKFIIILDDCGTHEFINYSYGNNLRVTKDTEGNIVEVSLQFSKPCIGENNN